MSILYVLPNIILVADSRRINKCAKKNDNVSVKKCVINGSNNLWVCVNAMNDWHTCVYCKCPSCYLTEKKLDSKKRTTRGRSHRMKSIDD